MDNLPKLTESETEEQYREYYGDVTETEFKALFAKYGEFLNEFPYFIPSLISEVRTRH